MSTVRTAVNQDTSAAHLIHLQHKVVLCKVWWIIVHIFHQDFNRLVHLGDRRAATESDHLADLETAVLVLDDLHHELRSIDSFLTFVTVYNKFKSHNVTRLTDVDPALLHCTHNTRAALGND